MNKDKVKYNSKDIISILRDLNMIVVSLDRIGSEYSIHPDRKSDEELNGLLADFIFEWNVPKRIARARKILDEAFSRELDNDEMDELEREFQDLQFWSLENLLPKNDKS